MNSERIFQLMQDTIDSMVRSGMLDENVALNVDSVILGNDSFLDSMGFVSFISDIEERISSETDQELYLILTDIHEFNAEQAFLSAGTLVQYIEKITK